MPLTRLDNLISSKTGKYLYVSPDDFNATDALSNRGNSPVTPFKSIQRAFLEIARYSYLPGFGNDRFDQFSIMLMPGIHYIDNRPGTGDTSLIDVFGFDQGTNAWTDDSIVDISNPDNIYWKFNNTEGGAIIPRGSSLVGYDLRRTTVRPLYVPDPATTEREIPRSAIFNVTGGCYFWQFTIKDGQTTSESPLYDAAEGTGKVYYDPSDFTRLAAPNFSHHKLTVFEYADAEELSLFYRKIAKAFSAYQPTIDDPGEFSERIQETRIVGPLSDSRVIESLRLTDATTDSSIPASTSEIEVTTKTDHGYFQGQFVAISNTEIDDVLEGIFQIKEIDQNDPRKFVYEVPFVVSGIGNNIVSGQTVSVDTTPALGQNAQTLAEVDSVESASPYVFNVSIRSTWGICGIWANGLKATGFKSMVIAQYTGVSLQKDDRAFIRYDEYTNTWNQASLTDAFATVPYHTKGDSYWKDDWRNFHVRASEDAFIQNVSIFAVGFADHFLMESGGDMSITNSNSNFGNTSLHAIGFKGFSFNQDKGGYITDIIPPKKVVDSQANTKKINYYTIDIQGTLQETGNYTKLFLGNDDIITPFERPAATIEGFRLGAKSDEQLYVKLDPAAGTDEFFNATLEPTGFVKYVAKGSILNPSGGVVNSVYADAANMIESNRRMIQEEVFGYILEKYPRLQNISYVNPGLNPAGNRYFDARNLILANRQEIVDTAFDEMVEAFGIGNIQGVADGKCKRDIGFIVDAIAEDLRDGGNANIIDATKFYFDGAGAPITNGLAGEENQSIFAFNRARDLCKKAIANLLTVQADLYDPDVNSELVEYGIVAGYTGSSAEEANLTDNGVTIDVSQKQDPAGRYKDARNRIMANIDFILDAALAEVAVYHPDFYIPGDTQTNDQSRFADAFRLIRRNSKEIGDKAIASLAVQYPNFYFPDEDQTNPSSRYADSYRLIQNNKNEIVDRALAQIAIFSPDFYFPNDAQTNATSRYKDSYRLIQNNKNEIVNNSIAAIVAAHPTFVFPGGSDAKCRRDIGYLVDAVSLDLFIGSNKYSRKFISKYFDNSGTSWIAAGLQGEELESVTGFNAAKDQMILAITNQLGYQDLSITEGPAQYGGPVPPTISRTSTGACDDVQSAINTLVNIVTVPIGAGNLSSLPPETPVSAQDGENKCRRDLGFFVDAIALDLFIQGNEYSYKFAAEYFTDASTPLADGLVGEVSESVVAFNQAAEVIKQAITNQLYEKDYDITADNAPGSAYGQVARTFTPHNVTYNPVTGQAVLSIANHDLSVGDFITIATDSLTFTCDLDGNTTQHTYPRATDPAAGQYIEITAATADTITVNVGDGGTNTSVHTFVSAAVNSVTFGANTANQLTDAQVALCSDVQAAVDTLTGIVTSILTTGNLENLPLELNKGDEGFLATKCRRDIGYFIDAIAVDMFTGGNSHTRSFTEQYFDESGVPISNGLVGETSQSVYAFNSARDLMKAAVTNALYYKDLTITPDPSPGFAYGSTEWQSGTNTANEYNAALCSDVQSAIDSLSQIATDAVTNASISGGIWNTEVNTGNFTPNFLSGETKCRRDLKYVVDAVAQDLWFGGNEYTIAATKEYFNNNALIGNGVDNEVGPSITAFKRAADLMNRAVNNQYYDRDLTLTLDQVGDPVVVADLHADAYNLVLANKEFIAEEAYQLMLDQFPAYTPQEGNTKQDCLDDVYDVLEAVMYDVKFGGNSKTYDAAKIYVDNVFNGVAIDTFIDPERDEAAYVFEKAKDLAIQVMRNEVVTASAGNSLTQTFDWTIVNDWDADELLPRCGSAAAAIDTLFGIIAQAIGTDAGAGNLNGIVRNTGAPADPAYNTTVPLTAVTSNTLTFNVGPSTHVYPHTFVSAVSGAIVSGGLYDHKFVSAAANSINVVGGPELTPSNATYDPATGVMVMYFGDTDLTQYTIGQFSFDDNSITFSCSSDNYNTNISYPRPGIDPVAGQNLTPSAVTAHSITVNVTATPAVEHDVTSATYNPATGDVVVTTAAAHGLTAGKKIFVKTEGLTFSCTKDKNVTTHSYPRAAKAYQPSTYTLGNCSDVLATIDTLIGILCDSLYAGNLDNLPPVSNGNWDCANVRTTIDNLFDILTDAIDTGSLAGLPPINTGDFTINNEASKCFRDVSYIVDAVVNDLRLGGNLNSIQAGEAYYVGNNLTYIDGEKPETIDAWNYVGQLATAAMRNFDVLAYNCTTTAGSAIIDVNDTRGIVIGMSVTEYTSDSYRDLDGAPGLLKADPAERTILTNNIETGTYVKRIVDNTRIELGTIGARLDQGVPVPAQLNSTTTNLYFELASGAWADTLPTKVLVGPEDSDVTPDVIADTLTSPSYRECSGTADAIETLIGNITTIINSGLGSVTRQEQTVNTALLASRATVFTIDVGGNTSDPHQFETGTPVRLVPRPRFDQTTGKYVDVDKRLVRLPNGFETNRTYYVIAPGRKTQPEDYSTTTFFDGNDQTRLMLATSKENAAAGIYIYASETDAIDKDVEIDMYQFVLDDKYDLHNYKGQLTNTVNGGIITDVSHIFDVPSESISQDLAQKVFIRAVEGGSLPLISNQFANDPEVAVVDSNDSNFGRINPRAEFFVRYQNNKVITLHKTFANANANVDPITFAAGQTGLVFDVFANKRRSPMRFDPSFTDAVTNAGKWYIQCKDQSSETLSVLQNNIFWRINQSDYSDRQRSTDMWYERLDDTRDADDRTYKLRFVIPKYLENARDPINGFVLKTRTDDTRKLVPQKVLLKPVTGTVYGARFENPVQAGEYIGYTSSEFETNNLNTEVQYDPYKKDQTGAGIEYRAFARFTSGVQATIQSGRYVEDTLDSNIKYLELTLYDHTIDSRNFPGLRNEILTTVKITAPQGGNFIVNKTQNLASDTNAVEFTGNSSGLANIHAYYSVGGDHYLIIKNIRGGKLEYSEFETTTFTQGNVFADMLEDQDMGKSLPLKQHIRKNFPEYYYKQNGANVYTITPGDRIQDDAGVEYYVASVEDTGIIEDTFYIFGYETLQKRIAGQQDGIYYLTALRGNISPYPTGAGVSTNFRKFKFSQPVSKLYPLNYRNDPLWFTKSGTTDAEKDYYANLIDPPSTFSAADNYVHGAVSVNDYKNSVTRELVDDLIKQPAFLNNSYTGDNQVRAQDGNATSGSEDRRISISGDSTVLSDQRYYVELRRPSIARAGNHTFEYLGFGPGNYSTGLPARQEVVLTPDQDFYAQAKKQDAGIVFYTGINSQGDLYIGNRRINAITGEETFIDAAVLADDGDENDTLGGLVTTFDTPVTFNQNITIVGGDGELVNTIESPLVISVQDEDLIQSRDSLIIRSNVSSVDPVTQLEQDESLDRTAFTPPTEGDIRISKNRIKSAVFQFNARGNGQSYLFQTHTAAAVASNKTPNQTALTPDGTRLFSDQFVSYGGVVPSSGDVLLKGSEIGKSGSLGWILSNYFTTISSTEIQQIDFAPTGIGANIIKLTFATPGGTAIPLTDVGGAPGINSSSEIRFRNFYFDNRLNFTWRVYSPPSDPFDRTKNYVYFQAANDFAQAAVTWGTILAGVPNGAENPIVEYSNSNWKELGVIGGESLRTDTQLIGDYKLGINTVNRAEHDAYENAFVSKDTEPRANLEVIGTTYITGRKTDDYLEHTNYADRAKDAVSDALVVGYEDSIISTPGNNRAAVLAFIDAKVAAFRVSTEFVAITEASRGNNFAKVGVNVTNSELDRAFVVKGDSRFTEDARFQRDIEVYTDGGADTGEIRTGITTGTFNLVTDSTFVGTLNAGNYASSIYIGNSYTDDQFIHIGRSSEHSNIWIGVTPDTATNISKVEIGGAYFNTNEDASYTKIRNRNLRVDGDMWLGFRKGIGQEVALKSQASTVNFFSNSGGPSTINFALNASEVNIAGQGGKTTINNQLEVIASAKFNGDVHICGGLASFSFVGGREQLGTTATAHEDGILGDALFNKNIDILNVLVKNVGEEGYNQVDTAGGGDWGNASYKQSVNIGGVIEPTDLPEITEVDQFYLPLKFQPVKADGDPYFGTNDYIIVNSAVIGVGPTATRHPEFLQVVELTRINAAPYYIKVKRRPFGAFGGVLENHPDTTPIYKVNVQFDATWTEQSLDNAGPQDNVYLAEFGGNLTNNDYVLIDRDDAPKTPEYIKVVSPLEQLVQKFRVSNCSDPDQDVFVVDSVTGEVTIGNPDIPGSQLTLNSTLQIDGGCGTLGQIQFTGDAVAGTNVITNVSVTSPNKTISDLKPGDYISILTDSSPIKFFQDTKIEFIFGGALYLSRKVIGASAVTGTTFRADRNEKFVINDGAGNTTFEIDTCTGTTTLGTHAGRFDLGLAWNNGFAITSIDDVETALDLDTALVYSYYLDPQTIQANGPSTTIREATATGSDPTTLQIPVQSLGEGDGQFFTGDYIAVGPLSSFSGAGQIEILLITGIVTGDTPTIIAKREQENTVAMSHVVGDGVRKIIRHNEQSTIADIQIRQRLVQGSLVDYLSVILDKAYISQQKLDYKQWLRVYDPTSGNTALFVVNGRLGGKIHTLTMDEQLQDGARSYREGSLNVTNDLTMTGGDFLIYDSVRQTELFKITNDDGHADHSGLINWDAGVVARGDFFLYPTSCPENVTVSLACTPSFSVDNLGNVTAQTSLTVTGLASGTPTNEPVFSVQNLGTNGANVFDVNRNRSIDAFGLNNFYTSTGARHTRYISAASAEEDLNLIPNIVYCVNVQATQTLILTLPSGAQTGDVVKIIDVGGNLKYDTTLVLRTPETSGTPIQGDSTGTLFGDRLTPYPSGELVVQTPNAAFSLIYLGSTDSNNQIGIPTSVQGWWLMEV